MTRLDPIEHYRSISELVEQLGIDATDFAWAGVRLYCGLVEGA